MEAGSPSKVQQAGGALEAGGAAAAAAAAAAAGAQQTSIGAVAGADAAVAAAAAAGGSGGGASAATTSSAALGEPPRVTPPVAFGIVEPGVYRSNVPVEANLDYLQGLGLRTALYLSPELPTRTLRGFLAANQIELHHLGLETWRPSDDGSNPISVELMKESLELLLDGTRHPLLVLCSSGLHHTGVLVGCLRRLQQWNLTSILQVRATELRFFPKELWPSLAPYRLAHAHYSLSC
jgi:protein tyrosine/serine phosphatase